MDITLALAVAGALVAGLVGYLLGRQRRTPLGPVDLAPVEVALERLGRRLDETETLRRTDQEGLRGEIGAQLRHVESVADAVRREAGQLSAALGRSDVRGRWGEAQLRRLVEAAGMLPHVHFTEQDQRRSDDGQQRPDLVVDLGAGRTLVVDAKVPLASLLEAEACHDAAEREAWLQRHARDVAAHVDRLSGREYWRRYDDSVEAVVMFLPAESILGIALREDPGLLERAFSRDVIVATPTTMLALLRTVSHVWRREALAEHAREVHRAGRELYERLAVLLDHVRRLGSALDSATSHYNKMVGSLETRVLVSARRLGDLGTGDDSLGDVVPITQGTREARGPSVTSEEAALP